MFDSCLLWGYIGVVASFVDSVCCFMLGWAVIFWFWVCWILVIVVWFDVVLALVGFEFVACFASVGVCLLI